MGARADLEQCSNLIVKDLPPNIQRMVMSHIEEQVCEFDQQINKQGFS